MNSEMRMRENRKFIRWDLNGSVRFKLNKDNDIREGLQDAGGRLKDISFAGIKMSLLNSLHLNDKLEMDIYLRGQSQPLECLGKVVWQRLCEEEGESPFCCGIVFTRFKDSDKERVFNTVHLFASENLKNQRRDGAG